MLARVRLFAVVVILFMSYGLTGRSARISAGFMIFGLIDDVTWIRTSEYRWCYQKI